ncbi:MAG: hypothetical protein GY862_28615 [Gammaproteobacteria bacterium]|nr:hypothetical protein [Gammaproteobacteria bacterium]
MSAFPYPGLRPFGRDEIDIFFGREEHTDQLIDLLKRSHFIAVVGPSGCGKSSLVRTGLLPGLETGLLATAGVNWQVVELRPGHRPFTRLAESLLGVLDDAYHTHYHAATDAIKALQSILQQGPFSIHQILRDTPLPKKSNLLLLVDQFEEIFRYYYNTSSTDIASEFVALLLNASLHPSVYVIITMRSDFLGDCPVFEGLPEAINQGLYLTPRLFREQLQEAIENPARVFNGNVEPALVNRLLNDVGTVLDQLPILQHVLMRIWDIATLSTTPRDPRVLTLNHYEQIGGLHAALSYHADEAYAELNAGQQRIAEILFRSLSERSSTGQYTRRPVTFSEVAALAEVSGKQIAEVAEVFRRSGRSFLMPPPGYALQPETVLDISHESLIRGWERLKRWTEQEAKSAELYQRLEDSARRWEKGKSALWRPPELESALAWLKLEKPTAQWAHRYGQEFDLAMHFLNSSIAAQQQEAEASVHEHRERTRLQRRIIRNLAVFLIIALGMLGVAAWQWQEAEHARNDTEQQREAAEEAKQQAQHSEQRAKQSEQARTAGLFDSQLTHASLLTRGEDYAAAKQVLTASRALDKKIPGPRRHARNLLAGFADIFGGAADKIYTGAGAPLFSVTVSPDGRFVAAAGEKETVVLFDAQTGELLHRLGQEFGGPGIEFELKEDLLRVLALREGGAAQAAGIVEIGDRISHLDDVPVKGMTLEQATEKMRGKPGTQLKITLVRKEGPLEINLPRALVRQKNSSDTDTWPEVIDSVGLLFVASAGNDANDAYMRDVNSVAFDSLGRWLVSAGNDARILRWSLPDGEKLSEWQAPAPVRAVVVSPDGTRIASGGTDNDITLWDTVSGEVLRTFSGHSERIFETSSLAFGPGGRRLASASYDDTARIWDVESGETLHVLKWHNGEVNSVAFSPNGEFLATGGMDKRIVLWETASGRPVRLLRGHQNLVFTLRFSADGDRLFSVSNDRTLRVWDIDSGATLRVLQGHEAGVTDIALHAGQMFSAAKDGTVRRWDMALPRQRLADLPDEPISAAIGPDGRSVAIGFASGALRVYALADARLLWAREEAHAAKIKRLTFNADGLLLASAGFDNQAKLWQVEEVPPSPNPVNKMDAVTIRYSLERENPKLSPEAEAARTDSRVPETRGIFKISLRELQTFSGHTAAVRALAFSPDTKTLATAGYDGQIGLFRVGTEEKYFLEAHEGRIASAAFDNSGTRLLSSGIDDYTLRLWDLAATPPVLIKELLKAQDTLVWADLSPNGQWAAAVGREQTVTIYPLQDSQTRSPSASLRLVGHENTVFRALFSPDSRQLATVSTDATVRLWNLDKSNELFSLPLPTKPSPPVPLWDFDFRCTPQGVCWIAVPLTRGKLALYALPYETGLSPAAPDILQSAEIQAQRRVAAEYRRGVDIHLQQGHVQPALQAAREGVALAARLAARKYPVRHDLALARAKLGDVLRKQDDHAAALEAYRQSLAIGEKQMTADDVEWQQETVTIRYRLGQMHDALQNPQAAAVSYQQAAALAQTLSAKTAHLPSMRNALAQDIMSFGGELSEQQRPAEAAAFYDALFKAEDLDNTDLLFQRIALADKLKRSGQAEQDLQRILALGDSEDANFLNSTGYRLAKSTSRYREAHDLIEQALALQPEDYDILDSMAFVLYKMDKVPEALEQLHKSQAKMAEDSEVSQEAVTALANRLITLGDALTEQQRADEAAGFYDLLFKMELDDVGLLFQRLLLADKQKHPEQFEPDLQHILALRGTEDAELLNVLGYELAERTTRYREAHDLLKQALALQPENYNILDSMGWVLYKMEKYPEALEQLRKSASNMAKELEVPPAIAAEGAAHLGEVLWVSGETEEAKKIWEQAARDFPDAQKTLRETMARFPR